MVEYRECTKALKPILSMDRYNPTEPSIKSLAMVYSLEEEEDIFLLDRTNKDQSLEQEYQAYIMEPQGKDINNLQYWKVIVLVYPLSRAAHWDSELLATPSGVSYAVCHGNGLPTNPGLISVMREIVLIQQRDGHKEKELYHQLINGSLTDA